MVENSPPQAGGWKEFLLFALKLAAYLGGLVAFGFVIFLLRRSLH